MLLVENEIVFSLGGDGRFINQALQQFYYHYYYYYFICILLPISDEVIIIIMTDNNLLPTEQKGCRRRSRGTKDQLLIDKAVMLQAKRKKKEFGHGVGGLQESLRYGTAFLVARGGINDGCCAEHQRPSGEEHGQLEDAADCEWRVSG